MAETKPIRTTDTSVNAGERTIRTYEEALNATPEPPTPTQEEADAIKEGTYEGGGEEVVPENETPEARERRQKREEDKRQRREAKAQTDQQAGYQTR